MERSRRGAGEPDHSRRSGPCARSAHTGDTGRVLLYPPPTQGDTPHPRGHPHGSAAPSAPPRWSATGAARAARLRRQAQEHRWPRCSPRIAHVLPAAERTSNDAERELLSQRAASRPITARPPPAAVLQPRPRWAGPRSAIRGGRVWHRGRSAPPTPSAPEQHRPHAAHLTPADWPTEHITDAYRWPADRPAWPQLLLCCYRTQACSLTD